MIGFSRPLALLLMVSVTAACMAARQHPTTAAPALQGGLDSEVSGQLDHLIKDVCSKSVVILGEESHHGGGRTLEIKVELVRRLIDRCGFDAVYFESGDYEFLDLNRRLVAGTSAPEQVADAIGGLWSVSNALDPLVAYLYAQASAGRVRLAGLDAQIGNATSGYEARSLAHDLAQALNEPRRTTCTEEISRRTHWSYDEAHPFDDAAKERLAACFRETADASASGSALSVLASATHALLTNPVSGRSWDARERQMARLFGWHQRQASGASRAIVWTANVHAARLSESVNGPVRPLGDELHAEYGDRLASIAFTSLGGAYGRGSTTAIPPAGADSLEARALAGGTAALTYLPKTALVALGSVDASPLGYDKPRRADWSLLFDGMFVLREEKPLAKDRPARPRFAPADTQSSQERVR